MKRRSTTRLLLASLGLVLAASPAPAEGGAANPPDQERAIEGPLDRFGVFDGTQLQVDASEDEGTATLSVQLPTGPSQENRFSLVVSTPLQGGDNAMPASLDALANGSKATLRFGHFQIGRVDTANVPEDLVRPARLRCVAAQTDPADPRHTQLGGACADPNRVMHTFALPDYRRYLARALTRGATDFGFDATVGINDFEWVDPVTFLPHKERHTDWSIAANFAQYFVGTMTAFTASASYQRAFEAADEQELCPTTPGAECVTARGAPPSRNEHFLISAGLRHRFIGADGRLGNLAIAPLVTYDAIDDVFGVDVPVYFIPDNDGALSGGIRFGYRSDRDDEFSIGIFVGAAFNILGGG